MTNCKICNATLPVDADKFEHPDFPGVIIGPCCDSCWEKAKVCTGCGQLGEYDVEVKYYQNGNFLCSSCVSRQEVCEKCGGIHTNFVTLRGKKVCVSCMERDYQKCKCCNKWKLNVNFDFPELDRLKWDDLFDKYERVVCKRCFNSEKSGYTPKKIGNCKFCGNTTSKTFNPNSHTEWFVCNHCHSNLSECSHCGEYHPEHYRNVKVMDKSGEVVTTSICRSCYQKKMYKCPCCATYYPKNLGKTVGSKNLCPTCVKTVTVCGRCNSYVKKGEAKQVKHYTLCSRCAEGLSKCIKCKTPIVNEGWGGYCRSCACEVEVAQMMNYSYRPTPVFNGQGELFFGFENEVSIASSKPFTKILNKVLGAYDETELYIKSDSSVTNGFEVVSHPHTFKAIKEKDWSKMFPEGIIRHKSCGMHVHMNKAAFTTYHLYKFINFFHNFGSFITLVAERSDNNFSYGLQGSLKEKAKAKTGQNKYEKINLNHSTTVELRVFANAHNVETFLKNIEFCNAIFMYTRDNNMKEISVKGFVGNLDRKIYPNLVKFFEDNKAGLDKIRD